MMPDEWIPYLLNKMGVAKDSLLEAICIIFIAIFGWSLLIYLLI